MPGNKNEKAIEELNIQIDTISKQIAEVFKISHDLKRRISFLKQNEDPNIHNAASNYMNVLKDVQAKLNACKDTLRTKDLQINNLSNNKILKMKREILEDLNLLLEAKTSIQDQIDNITSFNNVPSQLKIVEKIYSKGKAWAPLACGILESVGNGILIGGAFITSACLVFPPLFLKGLAIGLLGVALTTLSKELKQTKQELAFDDLQTSLKGYIQLVNKINSVRDTSQLNFFSGPQANQNPETSAELETNAELASSPPQLKLD